MCVRVGKIERGRKNKSLVEFYLFLLFIISCE